MKKFILSLIIGFIWSISTSIIGLRLGLAGQTTSELFGYTLGLPLTLSGLILSNMQDKNIIVFFLGTVIISSLIVYILMVAILKILSKYKKG